MVCGHPGAPCVQNIVHSKPGVWHGWWCVGQGANCVQIVAGVGGQPGPKNVHCGRACVGHSGPLCVQPSPGPAAANCGSEGQPKNVQSPCGWVLHPPNCEQATKSDAGQPTGVSGSGRGATARAAKAWAFRTSHLISVVLASCAAAPT